MTCGTCKFWRPEDKPRYGSGKFRGACEKMLRCFCCEEDSQIAGAIGGGDFMSFAEFGCNMWEVKDAATTRS